MRKISLWLYLNSIDYNDDNVTNEMWIWSKYPKWDVHLSPNLNGAVRLPWPKHVLIMQVMLYKYIKCRWCALNNYNWITDQASP